MRFLGKIPFPWEPLSQWSDSKREGYRCLFRNSSLGSGLLRIRTVTILCPWWGNLLACWGRQPQPCCSEQGNLSNELAISRRNSLFQSSGLQHQHSENLGSLFCSSRPVWATKQLPGQRGQRPKITCLKNKTKQKNLANKEGLEIWLVRESFPSVPQVVASLRFL